MLKATYTAKVVPLAKTDSARLREVLDTISVDAAPGQVMGVIVKAQEENVGARKVSSGLKPPRARCASWTAEVATAHEALV